MAPIQSMAAVNTSAADARALKFITSVLSGWNVSNDSIGDRGANKMEELIEPLLSIPKLTVSGSDSFNQTGYLKFEDKAAERADSPAWLFGAVLGVAFAFAAVLGFLIFTYYHKMMFAEFALAAINWRRIGGRVRSRHVTFDRSVKIDIEKHNLDEDEEGFAVYTTSSSHDTEPDGDDSGYGFVLQAASETREMPVYETALEGVPKAYQEVLLEAVAVPVLVGRVGRTEMRFGTVEALGLKFS